MNADKGDFRFGVFIGSIVGLGVAGWLAIGIAIASPDGTFREYQGFVGALLAASAAAIGAWAVTGQTREQTETNLKQKAEALRAQRAGLAFSCSELSDYCRQCISILARELPQDAINALLGRHAGFPDVPLRAVDNFIELAKFCDPTTAKAIATFLRTLQTQRSRLIDVENAINNDGDRQHLRQHQLDERIYDVLEVSSHIDKFFEYADFEREAVDNALQLDRLRAQVNINRLHGVRFDQLKEMIQRRHPEYDFGW